MPIFTNPTALPARTLTTTLAAILLSDCMVDAIILTNTTGSDVTVTIKDGNGKVFEFSLTIPAGTRQQLPLSQAGVPNQQGVFFAGGIQLSCSANTSVDAWIAARTQ